MGKQLVNWHYWERILGEVTHKHDRNYCRVFTDIPHIPLVPEKPTRIRLKKHLEKRFWLDRSANTYLTYRETQTIQLMTHGKTIKEIGYAMKLSMRTIEYYVRNIKEKLNCRTRSELISKVLSSNVLEQLAAHKAKEDTLETQ